MENVINEYNVTWYDSESHENFTVTFGDLKGAVAHANYVKKFLKKNDLDDEVFITEVKKHLRVMPESEWLDG